MGSPSRHKRFCLSSTIKRRPRSGDLACLHSIIIIFSQITLFLLAHLHVHTILYSAPPYMHPNVPAGTPPLSPSDASEHCNGSLLRNCFSIKFILAGRITTCADSKPPEYLYSHPPPQITQAPGKHPPSAQSGLRLGGGARGRGPGRQPESRCPGRQGAAGGSRRPRCQCWAPP